MIHARQSVRRGVTAQASTPRARRCRKRKATALIAGLAVSAAVLGCGDNNGINPEDLWYGQVGKLSAVLEVPLLEYDGLLVQKFEWASTGAWFVEETISYLGVDGDQAVRRNPGNPAQFAADYASLITDLNSKEGLNLFIPKLLADSVPDQRPACKAGQTTITLTIQDDARKEHTTWTRCADGSLANLTTEHAGPDPEAARIVQATILARDYTVGDAFASTYAGSVPFATLDRGEDLAAGPRVPTVFTDSAEFRSFWGQAGEGQPLPAVDFSTQMVVVAVVGERQEAGDSIEVRRVLQVDQGTLIEIAELIPGAFCSPASRVHVPFHTVVTPLTPRPHRFTDIRVIPVSCGG